MTCEKCVFFNPKNENCVKLQVPVVPEFNECSKFKEGVFDFEAYRKIEKAKQSQSDEATS